MFACTMVLYEYMKSLRNEVNNLFNNIHVRIQIYREFYHNIIYKGHHARMRDIFYTLEKYIHKIFHIYYFCNLHSFLINGIYIDPIFEALIMLLFFFLKTAKS
jgi:hypothetical protein